MPNETALAMKSVIPTDKFQRPALADAECTDHAGAAGRPCGRTL